MLLTRLRISSPGKVAAPVPKLDGPELQVWRDVDGQVAAYGHTVGKRCWMHLPGIASFTFDRAGATVVAVPHPKAHHDQIRDVYRRSVLPLVLQVRGYEAFHASGVLTPRGVVGLCAPSGTGKSTLAFGLATRGYLPWADDSVAFRPSEGMIQSIALPFSIRLRPEAARYFASSGRTVPSLSAQQPGSRREQRRRPALVRLLVLERSGDGRCRSAVRARRLSPVQSFSAILPHASCFGLRDARRKRRMVEHYLDLCARVPTVAIRFAPGIGNLPAVLDEIERAICEN